MYVAGLKEHMPESKGVSSRLAGLFGRQANEDTFIWQDREIRFDLSFRELECRKGEVLIDTQVNVEDTKASNGELGQMLITNLRLLWVSEKSKRINISIGYGSISSTSIKNAASRIRGSSQSMYVLTRFNGSRFEFIFTSLLGPYPRPFATLQLVHAAYESSKMYRELKLRANLLDDTELRLLPKEEIYHKVNGVWNLSSDQGNLGVFFITNVRVVWHADLTQNFNISIPYIRIKSTRVRESKFGLAFVIETTQQSGSYILGFRIDPKERMTQLHKEISSLWQVYTANPIFGVDFVGAEAGANKMFPAKTQEDDVEILESEDKGDLFAAYFADGAKSKDRPPVFCEELGLAIESLKTGARIDQFWKVL